MSRRRVAVITVTILAAIMALVFFMPRVFAPRAAVAYYVDNEALTDGDGSLDSPWNNIAGHVNDLRAGDTMNVRGDTSPPGRVYEEDPFIIDVSGTAGAPITIRAFPNEHVVIQCSTVHDYPFRLIEADHIHILNLTFDGEGQLPHLLGIYNSNHNVISGCEFYNSRIIAIDLANADHNTIENCVIHDCTSRPSQDAHGIILNSGTGNVFRDNLIYDITGDGIRLFPGGEICDTLIENNHIYTTLGGCSENGIDLGHQVESPWIYDTTIRGNVLHGFRYCDGSCAGTGGGIGPAITLHCTVENVLIEDNEIYDSTSGIMVNANNVQVINNLIHNLAVDEDTWLNAAMYIHASRSVNVHNNTFVECPQYLFYIGSSTPNLDIKNNLVHQAHLIHPGNQTSDYNGWFDTVHTLPGPHDTTGDDPLFTAGYRLAANSPARGAGENGTDLGAFPYETQATATPTSGGEWWECCTPPPTYPIQPTLTPRPIPTCRPPCASPTPYPTHTPYPVQPD